ncbi:MAG: FAD-dependent monooxygenase [Myxococcales bacterium]|nr:FAD-dependent monooxygenase [Myxococcales bacterium]
MNAGRAMGERAIVIGGSIAGMLAARVLSDHFNEVVVLEKDKLPDRPMKRKGVPQAKHGHLLLARGARIIQAMLPDLPDMATIGAEPRDIAQTRWRHHGVWKARFDSDLTVYLVNRIEFEHGVRKAVAAIPNIDIRAPFEVAALQLDDAGKRVIGVLANARRDGSQESIAADLVVDASGRGSRSPKWLETMGFGKPRETEVRVNVGYASCLYQTSPKFQRDKIPIALYPKAPQARRFGLIFQISERGIIVTLGGWCRDHPPRQYKGFLQFAESLGHPEFLELIAAARPSPSIHTHHFPSNMWRHYERLKRWPEGYVVMGDAFCSFNPAYGQGMTVCAIQADAMRRRLAALARKRRSITAPGEAHKVQRRMSWGVIVPFLLATSEDLRYPEVTGLKLPGLRALQWYTSHVLEASAGNVRVVRAFYEVMSLVRSPIILFHPLIVWAVLINALRRRRQPKAVEVTPEPQPLAPEDPPGERPQPG